MKTYRVEMELRGTRDAFNESMLENVIIKQIEAIVGLKVSEVNVIETDDDDLRLYPDSVFVPEEFGHDDPLGLIARSRSPMERLLREQDQAGEK